jgi:hypothetical protein
MRVFGSIWSKLKQLGTKFHDVFFGSGTLSNRPLNNREIE